MRQDGGTRVFRTGTFRFRIHSPDPRVVQSMAEIFEDLPAADDADAIIRVDPAGNDGLYIIRLPERAIGPTSLSTGVMTLVSALTRHALDADPDRLHLHAAGVGKGDAGIVISAASGTGKTTLTAELARRGWNYLSDEALVVDDSRTTLGGFSKPLSVKPSGRTVVAGITDARVDLGEGEGDWWHVPAGRLGAETVDEIDPHTIVVLEPASSYEQPAATRPLHPVDAVVRLMGETMDAERYGPHTLETLAYLAGRCRCVSMAVGMLDSQVEAFEVLLATERQPHVVKPLDTEHCTAIRGWVRSAATRSVVIGDRVVVHNTATGAIAALDEAGTAVWMTLHGMKQPWLTGDMLREIAGEFFAALSQVGFVERGAEA